MSDSYWGLPGNDELYPEYSAKPTIPTELSKTRFSGNKDIVSRLPTDVRSKLPGHWSDWGSITTGEAQRWLSFDQDIFRIYVRDGSSYRLSHYASANTFTNTDSTLFLLRDCSVTRSQADVHHSGNAGTESSSTPRSSGPENPNLTYFQPAPVVTRRDHDLLLNYTDQDGASVPKLKYLVTVDGVAYKGQLNEEGKAEIKHLPDGEAEVSFSVDEAEINRIRTEFKSTLSEMIEDRQARKQMLDDLLMEYNAVERGMILGVAFLHGLFDESVEIVEGVIEPFVNIATGTQKLMAALYDKLADGYSLDELKDDYATVCSELGEAIDQARQTYTILKWLATDTEVWKALIHFPKDWFGSMSRVEQAKFFGAAALELILIIAAAVATGGVGAVVVAGTSLLSKSRHLVRIAELLKTLFQYLTFKDRLPKPIRLRLEKDKHHANGQHHYEQEALKHKKPEDARHQSQNDNGECSPVNARCDTKGHPISMVTGEEITEITDFSLPGPIPLIWKRVYRSSAIRRKSELGFGWSHPWDITLKHSTQIVEIPAEDASQPTTTAEQTVMTVRTEEGLSAAFPIPLNDASSASVHNIHHPCGLQLQVIGDDFTLIKEGLAYEFETRPGTVDQYRLRQVHSRDHVHHWNLRYDPAQGQLISAHSSWGQHLWFSMGEYGGWRAIDTHYTGKDHAQAETRRCLIRYRLNRNGDLIASKQPGKPGEQFRYDHHLFVRHKTPGGLRFGFEWNELSPHARCVRQFAEDGHYDYRFAWNIRPNTHEVTDGRGCVEVYENDDHGRKIYRMDGEGHEQRWSYTDKGDIAHYIDGNGGEHDYEYDDQQRLIRYTDPAGQIQTIGYWRETHFPSHITRHWQGGTKGGPDTRETTHYLYDAFDQLIRVKHPSGETEHWDYHGQTLRRYIDRQGRCHQYFWNSRWGTLSEYRLFHEDVPYPSSELPDSLSETKGIWPHDSKTDTGPSKPIQQLWFDYDEQGRLHRQRSLHGQDDQFVYNDQGQLILKTNAQGQHEKYTYDRMGRVIAYTDQAGRITQRHYGAYAQILAQTLPDGTRLSYEYDQERNLTAIINGNGQAHRFEYDGCERISTEIGVDGRTIHYRYDGNGKLIEQHEGDITATFERDALGRLISERYLHATEPAKNVLQAYQYDRNGRLIGAVNEHAKVELGYTTNGLLSKEHTSQRFVDYNGEYQSFKHDIDFVEYTDAGYISSVRYSAHQPYQRGGYFDFIHRDSIGRAWTFEQNYAWNTRGMLSSMSVRPHEAISPVSLFDQQFNAHDQLAKRHQGQHTATWNYDPEQRLQQYQRTSLQNDSNRLTLHERHYHYDTKNRIAGIDELHGSTRYHYNDLDLLTKVENREGQQDLHFDAAGNRLPEGLTRLDNNRLPFMGDRHFSYDEYGNLVQIKKGKDQKIVQSLEYNAKHQLIKFEERINGTLKQALTFRYDPFGRRIEKSVFKQDKPEQQTEWATNYKRYRTHNQPDLWYQYAERYVWNGGNLIQTRHIDCNLNNRTFQQYYLYEPYSHKPVGLYDYELGLLDIEADHLGTAKALYSHETGEQLWATEHEVYGKTLNSQSHKTHPRNGFAVDPKLRFAGQYEDIETGLYQNFNRYYDPRTGRYISHDPIGLRGGLNLYQYCPNPVSWIDPLGLSKYPGVDFTDSPDLYPVGEGQKNIVKIQMQGTRGRDFTQGFKEAGISPKNAKGYTWHHVDDFNSETGYTTMQLVKTKAHEATLPHGGSVSQFEKTFGVEYGSQEAVIISQEQGWLRGKPPKPENQPKKNKGDCG
ncbi:RHS repeat-associated core domain-containing protein [Gynuella sp.]|uniref:RHS repeat-associated core domain-containing protein n=1 Tax=Gynuella sp. TaxID=2969146 RepID=UPI003D13DD05